MSAYKPYESEILQVDIHGMQAQEAKQALEHFITRLDPKVKKLVVIHGSNKGTALLNMVRKQLKSKRIKAVELSSNNGITTLIMK